MRGRLRKKGAVPSIPKSEEEKKTRSKKKEKIIRKKEKEKNPPRRTFHIRRPKNKIIQERNLLSK